MTDPNPDSEGITDYTNNTGYVDPVGKNTPSFFARVESEDFHRLCACSIDESMEIDPTAFNTVGEIEIDTVLE